jgi:putative flavoprotein involved in K+ transport
MLLTEEFSAVEARRNGSMEADNSRLHFSTIIIGGGQAGLSVGYHLARRGLDFVILDAHDRIGDSWRKRWDSLRLFTPAAFDGLDGTPFPAEPFYFPTRNEMADYLESYAKIHALPVRCGIFVDALRKDETGRFEVCSGSQRFTADHVVVAMSDYQKPKIPAFAKELRGDIVQLHSFEYRSPRQLAPGPVLVVGAGNSGADIALELSRSHTVFLSGRDTGHIPFRIAGWASRTFLCRFILKVLFHRLFAVDNIIGRIVRSRSLDKGGPLIRVLPRDLAAAGVTRLPRVIGTKAGLPLLEDGKVLNIRNVVWCTGLYTDFSWIHLPIFEEGRPIHNKGVVPNVPGLFFCGLHYLYSVSSVMVHGVGRDANRVAAAIERLAKRAAHS